MSSTKEVVLLREVVVWRVLIPPSGVLGSEALVAAAVARGGLVAVVATVVEAVAAKHLGDTPVVVAHEVRQGVAACSGKEGDDGKCKEKERINISKHYLYTCIREGLESNGYVFSQGLPQYISVYILNDNMVATSMRIQHKLCRHE